MWFLGRILRLLPLLMWLPLAGQSHPPPGSPNRDSKAAAPARQTTDQSDHLQDRDRELLGTVRISTGEWPPYNGQNLPHYGSANRIVEEAFRLANIEVVFSFYPWTRAYSLVKEGHWDASSVWAHQPGRENDFVFSEPIFEATQVFFHLKTTPLEWTELEDLRHWRIGGTLGYTYPVLTKAENEGLLTMERASSDILNFRKLLAGRIDLFTIERHVGLYLRKYHLSSFESRRLTHHPKPVSQIPMYLIISKKVPRHREILARFNRGLETLKKEGLLDAYLAETIPIAPNPQPRTPE
ncbi:Transporter substrate-binding domain-containing protein [Sulfidibacter corallicola]|uniref:Transporter substrate-binding domain-containing protein n=1 Tax=Sulfidibacter corallicola TaxID=2818388 RepID=A0A8A4TXQ1_SULCO|nr:transporter substrate-binding domain-containing protein [Sulfidibacter corallicola]QTD53874.1 transporter substrate-binding domain-containing protein [Sulfidibacter corallicola]